MKNIDALALDLAVEYLLDHTGSECPCNFDETFDVRACEECDGSQDAVVSCWKNYLYMKAETKANRN